MVWILEHVAQKLELKTEILLIIQLRPPPPVPLPLPPPLFMVLQSRLHLNVWPSSVITLDFSRT